MDRERKYSILRYIISAFIGGSFGVAIGLKIPIIALLALAIGYVLLSSLKIAYKDIILIDERVIKIRDRASAQTLRLFVVLVGFIFIGLMLLKAVGIEVAHLWNSLLPLAYITCLLIFINYVFYLYYKKKM
jgi:uncharacterized membrane protein